MVTNNIEACELMCGINGIYGLEGRNDVQSVIDRMNASLAHRGPDAGGTHVDDKIALGHQRLAIIDLSEEGNQPFVSDDGRYVMVYNGELYNYEFIKEKLDHPWRTSCDTEVVLAAYIQWGPDCLSAFNGMFAFAIWDTQKDELFIARDRLGIKPLYYSRVGNSFIFSSEIRALLSSDMIERKLDHDALIDYLRYQTVHAPHTLVRGVKMLRPGHFLKVTDNEQESHCYWDVARNRSNAPVGKDKDEIHQMVRESLGQAVERRLMSDVPSGAFLSGGIDSSTIVGLMSERMEGKISTFSVTFDEGEFSESKYSRMVADRFNTDHHEIKLSPDDFLKQVPDALRAMDHPSGDGPNTYVVSKATKEAGITVALSGLGGDEVFCGYEIFKRSVKLDGKKWVMSFPPALRNLAGTSMATMRPSVASDKVKELLKQDHWELANIYQVSRQVYMDQDVSELLHGQQLKRNRVYEIVDSGVGSGSQGAELPLLSKVSYAEINTYMQNVLLRDTDQMSMAHALEVRVPFLDHELVELVIGVNNDLKYPVRPKELLLNSIGDLLPREVWDRPKMGFTLPWEHWMKNEMASMVQDAITKLGSYDCFNATKLDELLNAFMSGSKKVTWARIWMLVVLQNWMQENGIEE